MSSDTYFSDIPTLSALATHLVLWTPSFLTDPPIGEDEDDQLFSNIIELNNKVNTARIIFIFALDSSNEGDYKYDDDRDD